MLHLFPHTCQIVRKTRTGSEDGTPIYEDEVVWEGPCRLDSPREVDRRVGASNSAQVATKVVRQAPLFLPVGAVVGDDDFVDVTRPVGSSVVTERWTVGGVEDAEGMTGPHHVEVEVYQEGNA